MHSGPTSDYGDLVYFRGARHRNGRRLRGRVVATLIAAVVMAATLAASARCEPAEAGGAVGVHLTYYLPTGDPMASGRWPYVGAAACSPDIHGGYFGTVVAIGDEVYTCEDLGPGVRWRHIDVYQPTHAHGAAMLARLGENPTAVILAYGDRPIPGY